MSAKYYISIVKDKIKTIYKFIRKDSKTGRLVFISENEEDKIEILPIDLKNNLLSDKKYDISLNASDLK
jgi:hypothetical protein